MQQKNQNQINMESKKWYQSKTIWGIVIAFVGYLLSNKLGVSGIDVPNSSDLEEIQKYYEQVVATKGNLSDLIGVILSIIGSLVALVGRIKAETTLK